ncbi:hypothetical protein O9G_000680 [Rozella allomycis CSF55]|uniref:RGS domain-containing protein n=1 Tax=Rozella allomycis (strain CSF55) TaxID=988480 RepID=A0A075AYT2_ROZAC|nr:hypothetical protein O9G_000680 [Rozella allomycis CSF55]|eukprot:EPZ35284.1 hypothetical protein O9G_000680 [Rozella allomycis CSF55]
MPKEIIQGMERYISNKLDEDGNVSYFDSFIKAQKEVLDRLSKRYWIKFLESSEYKKFQTLRFKHVSNLDKYPKATTDHASSGPNSPLSVHDDGQAESSSLNAEVKRKESDIQKIKEDVFPNVFARLLISEVERKSNDVLSACVPSNRRRNPRPLEHREVDLSNAEHTMALDVATYSYPVGDLEKAKELDLYVKGHGLGSNK